MKYKEERLEYNFSLREFRLGAYVYNLKGLYAYYERLRDKRNARGKRYSLADALSLITLAKLGGEDGPRGMSEWLKHRAELLVSALKLPRESMPHPVTISRILGKAVDINELEQLLAAYFDGQVQQSRAILIAIDGKIMRGTIEIGPNDGLHLLAAYLPEEGLVLMQVEVECKENEIVAAPKLLEVLDLRGKVVVGDALHTQRQLSIEIVTAGGDYLWTAKGNQPYVQETIAHLFEPEPVCPGFAPTPTDFKSVTVVNKGHGRIEKRTLTTSSMLKDYLDWPYLQQVFKLQRQFTDLKSGKVSRETCYGLTSLTAHEADPARLLQLSRSYWGIENGLHYRRDVSLKEDRCRLKIGHAARTMATLNNLVLALILRQGFSHLPQARRLYAAQPLEALKLIFQPSSA
jgi:predicted transposase YbfD/YdcC